MTSDDVAIHAQGLHKSFGDLEVLKSVDLTVRTGEVVVIMGPSGAGKTTLLRCLNLLEEPDAGSITVRGRTVNCAGPRHSRNRRRLIRDIRVRTAMVFQQFNLFPHMTALQNVIEGPIHVRRLPRPYAIEVGERLLARVGLTDKRDEHPARLSGGQKQRVAIARALAMEPEVILFDEPTSALDPELRAEVLQAIKNLAAHGMTMVIVTHEIAFAREVADRVVFMDKGYILEEQSPSVFFSNPANTRIRSFLRLMSDSGPHPELEEAS
ncbi:amino acid ABC transporter ATP-binding protein [Planotetraspora kaengkrachanensis]|uniref:ABC-type polar-amino-acid transporter n=1 Tax=Planotetraspora kaengkrachanensis TaxID=575193 RepID=A0A8J3PS26_9ACTN|nr:amino acid ABC transporter ATP-binding protein [Planotetraspora kaengkrachanensis]GIG77801.1 ABC transporter ATP-binding protein [Planotetraspora kaengkrachanensis]